MRLVFEKRVPGAHTLFHLVEGPRDTLNYEILLLEMEDPGTGGFFTTRVEVLAQIDGLGILMNGIPVRLFPFVMEAMSTWQARYGRQAALSDAFGPETVQGTSQASVAAQRRAADNSAAFAQIYGRDLRNPAAEIPLDLRADFESRVQAALNNNIPLGRYAVDGKWVRPEMGSWDPEAYRAVVRDRPNLQLTAEERLWRAWVQHRGSDDRDELTNVIVAVLQRRQGVVR